jgi:hypothetical protein
LKGANLEKCPFDLTPYKLGANTSRPQIFSLNYTNQDFWSMKARLVSYIKEKFGTEFNDFVESSLGIMLIENWAFIADTLSFKTDQIANEVFIDTVTELEDALRLARLVGFDPQPPIAGKSLWSARVQNTYNVDLEIPAPFPVDIVNNNVTTTIELFPSDSLNRPIYDENIYITAGTLINSNIVGIEGRTYSDIFNAVGGTDQAYLLSYSPVLLDSIRVSVDGVKWDQVKFFTESAPRREYRIEYNSDYSVYIIFGNNRAGYIPPTGSTIQVVYRVGGGPAGNIVSNFVNTQTLVPIPGEIFSSVVNLTNYTKGEFGYAGDTIEDIRYKLPIYNQSQNRCVSGIDYKNYANLFKTPYNGVMGKTNAVLRHSGCSSNIIELYILAKVNNLDLAKASSQFKYEFTEYMNSSKMMTDYLSILDGEIILSNISVNVVMDKYYKKFEDEIKFNISSRIENFFSINNWDYEQNLRDVDIIKALSDMQQPSRYDIYFTTNDPDNSGKVVRARYFEIIRPESIAVSFTYE